MSEPSTLFEEPKAQKDRPRMTTALDVLAALRLRYPAGQYALLAEVGNSTGFKCRRHADAIVMGLWPSRGLEIYGIEVKVRRSDWLKELEQPEKAHEIAAYCDRWFVAVGDAEIIKPGELPPLWGLLVPKDATTLRCAKEAEKLPDIKPLDRGFIAAILRQAQDQLTPQAELNREYERGRQEGIAIGKDQKDWDKQRQLDALLRLDKDVKEFEAASGVKIKDRWQIGNVGKAVEMLMNGTIANESQRLERFKKDVENIVTRIDWALQNLKTNKPVYTGEESYDK